MNDTLDNGALTRVILIGGAPLSGKTAAARSIGRQLAMPVIATDHLGEAARAVTNATSHSDLHACSLGDYRKYFISHPPEQLLQHALRAHHALWPSIEAVIRRRLDWEGSAVIEGWALLPNLVTQIMSPNLHCAWIETPEPFLVSRLQAQPSFVQGADYPSLLTERFIARSLVMNAWLREQTHACGCPSVVLSGLESPDEVSNLCLKEMGIAPTVTEYYASGNTPKAAHH